MRPNPVGLGTFPLANVFTKIDRVEKKKILNTFLFKGGFFIDTAPIYGQGQVEIFLGQELKHYPRDSFFLSTKCGYVKGNVTTPKLSGKYHDVISECNASLRRLKLDYIDLYLSHRPDPMTPFEETLTALVDLKSQGKIKHIGVSNVTSQQLQRYNRLGHIEFIQVRYSIINNIEIELLEYCIQHGIRLVPYQVIERGLLTDNVLSGFKFADGDLRLSKPEFSDEKRYFIEWWVNTHLLPIAESFGVSISVLSILWILQQPNVAYCLCGVTNEQQVIHNLMTWDLNISKNTVEIINTQIVILEEELQTRFSMTLQEFLGIE